MVNVLREYNRLFNKAFKWDKFLAEYTWNYYTNIHPRSESQFQTQRFLAGINPWYGSWMESRSLDERNRVTREQYGIGFGDVTYPWLSGLTSTNETKTLGSAAWSFSRNMARLYN